MVLENRSQDHLVPRTTGLADNTTGWVVPSETDDA